MIFYNNVQLTNVILLFGCIAQRGLGWPTKIGFHDMV